MNPTVNGDFPENDTPNNKKDILDSLFPESQVTPPQTKSRKTSYCQPDQTVWWRMMLEAFVGAAVITYTVVAGWQLHTMNQTFTEVQKQTQTAQGQLAVMQAGQRPWLGLGSPITLTTEPKMTFNPILSSLSMNIEGTSIIHNYGTAPAFDVRSEFVVQWPFITGDTVTRPDAKWFDCSEKGRSGGEVVFPASGFVSGFTEVAGVASKGKITEVGRIWLLGCITYHDSRKTFHTTKVWLRSHPPRQCQMDSVVPKLPLYADYWI